MTNPEAPNPQQILSEEEHLLISELQALEQRRPTAFAPKEEQMRFLQDSIRLSGQIELLHDLKHKFEPTQEQ